ncbi:facilitated trehalose transporter Tret1-like isoform X2 [Sitophilus oryzae]|uniref:Facilitated trehalose transporter Tret1-like isoform X2 n=1 Tax=Sitophilus oryzae TaxID=7048 RepID=A0A6J2XU64_SITOR|nr:facilitated trehalose transporter Tret1-like isoform X2 [Sitophilus oryzae]
MSPKLYEILAALGPLLLTIVVGMTFGYSAVLLPQLQSANSSNTTNSIRINREEASWVASLAVLPMALGTLIGGAFIQKYGRKMTHQIMCLPYFAGWMVIYFAFNLEMILVGRFLTGLCSGILTPATGVYIGETSAPKYRGVLLGGVALSVSAGLLLTHLLGTFLTWQITALITSILPLLSLFSMIFTPESPSWLAQKGFTTRATESFKWLRGNSDEATNELEEMLAKHKDTENSIEETGLKDMLKREFLKPMGILVMFFITSQWTGVNAVNFYSVALMKQTIEGVNEYLATFVIDCIRLVSSVISCILLRKIGRRPLILAGGLGTILSLFTLSGYIYFTRSLHNQTSFSPLSIIPMVSLIVYIFFVTAGFVSLPWNLLGELLPLKYRSTGSGIASCIAYLSVFSVVKTMPDMFAMFGSDGTFLLYGIMGLVGTIFIYFCLPETKGKTLNEIEEYFKGTVK